MVQMLHAPCSMASCWIIFMSQNQLLCTNLDILHLSCGSGAKTMTQGGGADCVVRTCLAEISH